MKTLLVFVAVGVVIVAPAFAQPRSKAVTKGGSSRVHHYAGKHYAPRYPSYGNYAPRYPSYGNYAPRYPSYGNGNTNPDFPFCVTVPGSKC
jgi:hypothetical protein